MKDSQQLTVNGKQIRLSVVYATKNEEDNITRSLDSVKELANEIIVFDEFSEDRTREIAKDKGAKVFKYQHKTNFHETKQKAIEKASGDWILQLDADEVVTPELAEEIVEVINSEPKVLQHRVLRQFERPKEVEKSGGSFRAQSLSRDDEKKLNLFKRYQKLIEQRDGKVGENTG